MSAFMEDELVSQALDHLVLVERVSAQIRSGDPPASADIERVLEGGFGCLVGLEANLQRDQAQTGNAGTTTDLRDSILRLSEGLNELRTLSSPYSSSRIGYGFVLPQAWRRTTRA
jgi:hypothetical protein